MQERRIVNTSDVFESDPYESGSLGLDMARLIEAKPFHETHNYLKREEERFCQANWKGGLEDGDGPYSLEEVMQLLVDIRRGKMSPSMVSANQRLAFHEALQFAGANPPDRQLLQRLRHEAEQELVNGVYIPASHALYRRVGRSERSPHHRRKLSRAAAALPVVLAVIYGSWELFAPKNGDSAVVNVSQPRSVEVSGTDPYMQEVFDQEKDESKAAQLLNQLTGAVETFVDPIRQAEAIEYDSETPGKIWGIDWTNSQAGVEIFWDDPEVAASRLGISPEITFFPVAKKENRNMMSQCLPYSGLDCSWVHEGSITIGGHVGIDADGDAFSLQDLKEFLEFKTVVDEVVDEQGNAQEKIYLAPLSVDEQKENIAYLEDTRPIVRQVRVTEQDGKQQTEVVEVKAKAAIVRIPPLEADRHYAAWFDYNRDDVIKIALEVDPGLGKRVNLDKPYVVLIGCDERFPGEAASRRVDLSSTYQAMWVIVLGEAPTSKTSE